LNVRIGGHDTPDPALSSGTRSSNLLGSLYTTSCAAQTGLAFLLSASDFVWVWLLGQLLLALALMQWFILLHELGHMTFFGSRQLNTLLGHVASFFSAIPFHAWRKIHSLHHKWTGWQDRDPTTRTLVSRSLSPFERSLTNTCWKFSIPLFGIIYRINNFWNLPRLRRIFPDDRTFRLIAGNVLGLAAVYVVTAWLLGAGVIFRYVGLAAFLTLVLQEWLILSQHTHIRMQQSHGEDVRPFTAAEQEIFTRSLLFPGWVARGLLINVNAHELHHVHPAVPGYRLHRISRETVNSINWWHWLKAAKAMRGEQFLFHNREETGIRI